MQYLKSQGVQLCDNPTFPTPEILSSQDPEVATDDSPQWIIYWYVVEVPEMKRCFLERCLY